MMTVWKCLHVWLFSVLCVLSVTEAQQQPQARSNPFLIHQHQHRLQQQQQTELKKLQMHMLKSSASKDSPQKPSHHQPPPAPAPRQPQQQANRLSPASAPSSLINPFSPPQHGSKKKPAPTVKKENRNEMHKGRVDGRPGPTPWTRWTPRPDGQHSPWQGQDKVGPSDLATCGSRRYSPRDHICCEGSLQNRQGLKPACCGSASFDFVFSLCCQGQVTARTAAQPFC